MWIDIQYRGGVEHVQRVCLDKVSAVEFTESMLYIELDGGQTISCRKEMMTNINDVIIALNRYKEEYNNG